jgi:hypothetical protein
MPADLFLVTDKIMLKNPHRKRYKTSSEVTPHRERAALPEIR